MSLHILYCHPVEDLHTVFSICDSCVCVCGGVMGLAVENMEVALLCHQNHHTLEVLTLK